MLAEEGFVLLPRLDRVLVELVVQGKEDLGWLIERMISPVNAEPQQEKEGRDQDGTNDRR